LGRGCENLKGIFLLNEDSLEVSKVVEECIGFLFWEGPLPDILLVPDFNTHYLLILGYGKDLEDLKLLTLLILRRNDLQYIAVEPDVAVLRVLELIIPPLELG
jgi:hypothetical protein